MINFNGLKAALLMGMLWIMPAAFAQNKYQSHMWEITGNGLSKPSYLFGTMHVSNKVAFHLGDPFYDAIEGCDFVALELEPDIWMHEMFKGEYFDKMMNKTFRFQGNGGGKGYNGNFLFETDSEELISAFLKTDDGFTNFMLTRSIRGNEDFEEDSWLDMHIYQCAKKMRKQSFGLETFASSMANAERATKEQYKDKDFYKKSDERMEMQTKMEAAYRRGDLDFVDSLSRISYPGESYKYMLTDRNDDFVHTMDSLMKQGALFAAMGCAHLPGPDGVIEKLRAMGYTVTPKSKGERDAKRKAEVEKKLIERPLQHFTSPEGLIAFDAPSEVFSMTTNGMGVVYLSLDMPNGGNFMLQRSEWWPSLFKMNTVEMADAIENLLYEKIKGDIISQKRSMWGGYPAFDILSKTVKGDITRMKIIVTDNELIKLTVQAPRDIVKKGYGKFFFDTFQLKESAASSAERSLFDDKLIVTVPGIYHTYEGDVEINLQGIVPSIISNNDLITIIAKGNLSNPKFIDESEYELQEFGRYFFNQTGYDDSLSSIISWPNGQAIRASYSGINDRKTEALLFGKGFDYYAVQVLTENPSEAENIFKTIRLKDHIWPSEYHVLTDSTLMFCAEVPWKPEEEEEEDDLAGSMFGMFGGAMGDDKKEDKDVGRQFTKKGKVSDPDANDQIEVKYIRNGKYEKFAPYSWVKKDTASKEYAYFRTKMDAFNPNQDYAVSDSTFQITSSGFEAEYIFTDTLCSRAHRVKYILDDMSEYVITYVNESDKIHNPFIDHFLETFTPLEDSITKGISLFEDKFEAVYAGLQNPDTLEFKYAHEMNYSLVPKDEKQLKRIKDLSSTLSPVASEDEKKYLEKIWKYYQYLDKSDAMVESLTKEYNTYQDSADYQLQILQNLINMETKKSRLSVKDLLLKEPPIVEEPDFIYNLNDSIEKIVKIIPSLLTLTQYEEYKWPLYDVLSDALDSNAIKPSDYAYKVQDILREARLELKRTAAITEESSDSKNYYYDNYDTPGNYPPSVPFEMDEYESYSYSTLNLYLNLLEPHKSNPDVASFLKQIGEHKKEAVLEEYAAFLLSKDQKVPDAIAMKFIDEEDKIGSVNTLENMERQDLIPSDWNLLEEYLISQVKESSNGYYEKSAEIDSVLIDTMFTDRIKSKKYNVYFVRSKEKDATEWKKHVVAMRVDNLSKDRLLPNQYISNQLSDDAMGGGFNLFGMGQKSKPKKELSDDEKMKNLWLDMKSEQRNPNGYYGYGYYPDYSDY